MIFVVYSSKSIIFFCGNLMSDANRLIQSISLENPDLDSNLQEIIDMLDRKKTFEEFKDKFPLENAIQILNTDVSHTIYLKILRIIEIFTSNNLISIEYFKNTDVLETIIKFCSSNRIIRSKSYGILYNISKNDEMINKYLEEKQFIEYVSNSKSLDSEVLLIIGNMIQFGSFDFDEKQELITNIIIKHITTQASQNMARALTLIGIILRQKELNYDISFLDVENLAQSNFREVVVALCYILECFDDLDEKYFYLLLNSSKSHILLYEPFLNVIFSNGKWMIDLREDIIMFIQQNISKMNFQETKIAIKVFENCQPLGEDYDLNVFNSIARMADDPSMFVECINLIFVFMGNSQNAESVDGFKDCIDDLKNIAEEMLESADETKCNIASIFLQKIESFG